MTITAKPQHCLRKRARRSCLAFSRSCPRLGKHGKPRSKFWRGFTTHTPPIMLVAEHSVGLRCDKSTSVPSGPSGSMQRFWVRSGKVVSGLHCLPFRACGNLISGKSKTISALRTCSLATLYHYAYMPHPAQCLVVRPALACLVLSKASPSILFLPCYAAFQAHPRWVLVLH